MTDDTYHKTRFTQDSRRNILWQALWRYHFRHRIHHNACVLDLGCGYGNFINEVQARRRIAIDQWPGFTAHIAPDVEAIVGSITDLAEIADDSVDFAFASNVFEHISQDELAQVLVQLRRKLTPSGVLCILQPNYRYAFREYFDDYTHVTIWSHISLPDFLAAHSFEATLVHPRFLPLTIKSGMPVHPFLIRSYLASPFRPFGKQMLIEVRAKPL